LDGGPQPPIAKAIRTGRIVFAECNRMNALMAARALTGLPEIEARATLPRLSENGKSGYRTFSVVANDVARGAQARDSVSSTDSSALFVV
jgi:hypothetical protein